MSRITKYLESLMKKKDYIRQSETTSSVYYFIDKIKIRVSDHFTSSSKCDISIVNPMNNSTTYLVQIKEGPQVLQFSLKDLKTFISNYCFIRRIQVMNKEVQNVKKEKVKEKAEKKEEEKKREEAVLNRKLEDTSLSKTFAEAILTAQRNAKSKKEKKIPYILSIIPFTSDGSTWLELTARLNATFPRYSLLTKRCKEALRKFLYKRSNEEIDSVMTYLFEHKELIINADRLKYYFLYEENKEE